MAETKLMSDEEKYKLLKLEYMARESGNFDEATRLKKLIPLDAELANSMKKIYGMQYLKESGYNLSEAEAVYGKEWYEEA